MNTITRHVHIAAPRADVWAALADFGNVSRMSAGVESSKLTSELQTGVGTTRHCDLAMMGASVEERITGWTDQEQMDVEMYEWSKMPMVTKMGASFQLDDDGTGTKLTGSMLYALGMGPIGAVMNALMMRPMMSRNWERFLAGIKLHLESGEVVNSDSELDMAAVVSA